MRVIKFMVIYSKSISLPSVRVDEVIIIQKKSSVIRKTVKNQGFNQRGDFSKEIFPLKYR